MIPNCVKNENIQKEAGIGKKKFASDEMNRIPQTGANSQRAPIIFNNN